MKKFVTAAACGLVLCSALAGPARAADRADGSDHGRANKVARLDPSAQGRDCLAHGALKADGLQAGGINEDHCAAPADAQS